jgi:hypothetical protein
MFIFANGNVEMLKYLFDNGEFLDDIDINEAANKVNI